MSVFQSYTNILAAAPSGTTANDLAADFVQSQLGAAAANVSYTGSTNASFDVDVSTSRAWCPVRLRPATQAA